MGTSGIKITGIEKNFFSYSYHISNLFLNKIKDDNNI